ncbi:hypothetical protein HK102_012165, partial [Quaeritorhiza haematococci]
MDPNDRRKTRDIVAPWHKPRKKIPVFIEVVQQESQPQPQPQPQQGEGKGEGSTGDAPLVRSPRKVHFEDTVAKAAEVESVVLLPDTSASTSTTTASTTVIVEGGVQDEVKGSKSGQQEHEQGQVSSPTSSEGGDSEKGTRRGKKKKKAPDGRDRTKGSGTLKKKKGKYVEGDMVVEDSTHNVDAIVTESTTPAEQSPKSEP